MKFIEVKKNKKKYLSLLLLGDEQESMIDKYLDRGNMYILYDHGVKAECVVTNEGNGILEIKNLAVLPQAQNKGYGKAMLQFIEQKYQNNYQWLQVGTGDSPLTIPFYQKCGFTESHRIKNFFTNHYDHPIIECGIQLIDMIYLKKNCPKQNPSKSDNTQQPYQNEVK